MDRYNRLNETLKAVYLHLGEAAFKAQFGINRTQQFQRVRKYTIWARAISFALELEVVNIASIELLTDK